MKLLNRGMDFKSTFTVLMAESENFFTRTLFLLRNETKFHNCEDFRLSK